MKDNFTERHIIIAFIVIGTFGIWLWGAASYQISAPEWLSWLPSVMGKPNAPQDIFAPVAAFFSGLSAIATAFLIYLQQKTNAQHNKEIIEERIISHFFTLINSHDVSSIRISGKSINGHDAIKYIYNMLNYICAEYKPDFFEEMDEKYNTHYDYIDVKDYNNGVNTESSELLTLEIAFKYIEEDVNHCLEKYFHRIYAMLKYVEINKNVLFENGYLRTLRSQFDQYEFALLYYYGAQHIDTNDKEKKLKKIIEKTAFLHNINKDLLFHNFKEKDFYEKSAYGMQECNTNKNSPKLDAVIAHQPRTAI